MKILVYLSLQPGGIFLSTMTAPSVVLFAFSQMCFSQIFISPYCPQKLMTELQNKYSELNYVWNSTVDLEVLLTRSVLIPLSANSP